MRRLCIVSRLSISIFALTPAATAQDYSIFVTLSANAAYEPGSPRMEKVVIGYNDP